MTWRPRSVGQFEQMHIVNALVLFEIYEVKLKKKKLNRDCDILHIIDHRLHQMSFTLKWKTWFSVQWHSYTVREPNWAFLFNNRKGNSQNAVYSNQQMTTSLFTIWEAEVVLWDNNVFWHLGDTILGYNVTCPPESSWDLRWMRKYASCVDR